MRYIAKDEEGRTVGEGRTIITAVNRAKKRDGAYVVDDSTGVIQWRRPGPSPFPLCDCGHESPQHRQMGCGSCLDCGCPSFRDCGDTL